MSSSNSLRRSEVVVQQMRILMQRIDQMAEELLGLLPPRRSTTQYMAITSVRITRADQEPRLACAICLEDFKINEDASELQCKVSEICLLTQWRYQRR